MSTIKGLPVSSNNLRELDKNKKTAKSESSKGKDSASVTKSSQNGLKDSVNISSLAKELLQKPTSIESLKVDLDNIKTLDRSTLKEIHNKMESNYYEKPEVIDKIVDGLIPEAHSDEDMLGAKAVEDENQLQQIQENIENGKYDSEEVLNTIVDRMLDPDNLMS